MAELQQSLTNSLRQEQQLSTRQLQSLELLNLPVMALEEHLNQVLAANPVLEIEHDDELPIPEAPLQTENPDDESTYAEQVVDNSEEWADELPMPPGIGQDSDYAAERQEYLMNSLTEQPSLQEQLHAELATAPGLSPRERELAELVVDAIDDTGYLRSTVADLSMSSGAEPDEIERALKRIQQFDPPGVGARDLPECLRLQLERSGKLTPVLAELLAHHLDEVARNHLPQLARKLHITMEELNRLLQELKELTPYPGSMLAPSHAEYILPEAAIIRKGDDYEVVPRRQGVPRLYLAERYLKLLETPSLPAEDRSYLRDKMQQAREVMRALELRQSTILRIAEVIARTQREFLDRGVEGLKPLTMKQVGDQLELHETTISRAVANKYLETPQGIKPFKFFFSAGFTSEDGAAVSNRAVMEKIKELIDQEDPAHPLSDEQLAQTLKAAGLAVARRTVAKYREGMNIPSSSLRKHHC